LQNCGHRLIHYRRERSGWLAFQQKPRENYALKKAKSTFPSRNTQTSPLWRIADAI
jgi:hypothetical protein